MDRIRSLDEDGNEVLYTEAEDVKREAANAFKQQFRKRLHKFNEPLPGNWEEIYKPRSFIKEDWFNNLDACPNEQEWHNVLKSTKNKSALSRSGIRYRFLKKTHEDMHNILRKFTHLCYLTSIIPTDWKVTSLYPIPKPTDWNFSLSQTRPIILIECIRKVITKILGSRMSAICSQHNILKGPNFAGLKNESTDTLIHILNGIMEEAIEVNRKYG